MVRRAVAVFACLAAGAVAGALVTPRRLADASTFVLMVDSLVHDGDLRYEPRDLARARALRLDDLPAGLLLVKRNDGAWAYAKPALYPVVASPWYAAFGLRGLLAMNGALLAALGLLGVALLAPRLRGWRAGLVAIGILGGSVVPSYVFWIDPFLLLCAVVAAGVVAHGRGWPATSGALLGVAVTYRYPYVAVAAVPLLLHLRARRFTAAARGLAGLAMAVVVTAAVTVASTGEWSPYLGERYYFAGGVPFDGSEAAGRPFSRAGLLASWTPPSPATVAQGLLHFVAGRSAGILLYFPAFFACLLWMRRWSAERALWLAAVAGFALLLELTVPHNRTGGSHAVGNRFFVLLPLAFCFVDPIGWRPWRVAGTALLVVLALPLLHGRLEHSLAPGRLLLAWPHRLFPFEWPLARHVSYPATFPGLYALTANQHAWEAGSGGFWTVGGTRAEFVLVRPRDRAPRVRLASGLSHARVTDGRRDRLVRLDGGAQEITLADPMAVFRDEYGDGGEIAVYRLAIETDRAFRPAASGRSADTRALGVAVQPLS